MQKNDIIVIILVLFLMTIIIVINIKKILNDKLTNIEVKIPEIDIPQPNIIVQVQKKCDSDNYDVHIKSDNNIKTQTQRVGLSPINEIEKFDPNIKQPQKDIIRMSPINKIETFDPYIKPSQKPSDAIMFDEKLFDVKEITAQNSNYKNIYENDDPTHTQQNLRYNLNNHSVQYPIIDNIIDYDNIKKHNQEINQIIEKNDNYDDNEKFDTLQYFLKTRQFVPASFEDGITHGSNYDLYMKYGKLSDIGEIPIGKNDYKYPKPNNYLID